MKKQIITVLIVIGTPIFFLGFYGYVLAINIRGHQMTMHADIRPYMKTETIASGITSRNWMRYALYIQKKEHYLPHAAAYLYAYVASVYDDTLQKTRDTAQASIATATVLNYALSPYRNTTTGLLYYLHPNLLFYINKDTSYIINQYKERINKDNLRDYFSKIYQSNTDSPGSLVPVGQKKDPVQKYWSLWILPDNLPITVPPPPKKGSMEDTYELEIMHLIQSFHVNADPNITYYTSAIAFTLDQSTADDIGQSGIWQNILFTQAGHTDDFRYSANQKRLAEVISDAYVYLWKTKYLYTTKQPSLRVPNLFSVSRMSNFPGYYSESALIGTIASKLLSEAYPQQSRLYEDVASDLAAYNLLTGTQFDIDNKVGTRVGKQLYQSLADHNALQNQSKNQLLSFYGPDILLTIKLYALQMNRYLRQILNQLSDLIFRYRNAHKTPAFTDTIEQSGIYHQGSASGMSWGDYDNDGSLDVFIAGSDKVGNQLYHNNGNGTFTNVTEKSGILAFPKANSGVWGDYDNDGCRDIVLTINAPHETLHDPGHSAVLYHNNCNGTFTNVTKQSGMTIPSHATGAAWADYDNDGYLDLAVANFGIVLDQTHASVEPNFLYHNNKNGTFTNVAKQAGVEALTSCKDTNFEKVIHYTKEFDFGDTKESYQPLWFDYDNDGRQDLFVTTDYNVSPLFHNNGNGTFTDVTLQAGLCVEASNMGATVGDIDSDGYLDVYVTNIGKNFLWHNNKNGTFTEISEQRGVASNALGWGTEFIDYDNDGLVDLYVINGIVTDSFFRPIIPTKRDRLYKNNGDGTFTDTAGIEGIEADESKDAGSVADINNDGYPDLLVISNFKDEQEKAMAHHLYINHARNNRWITFQLTGTKSNRDGIGAKISVTNGTQTQIQEVTAGSSFQSQRSSWITFGFGKITTVKKIIVLWPSGRTSILRNIKTNQQLSVHEPTN